MARTDVLQIEILGTEMWKGGKDSFLIRDRNGKRHSLRVIDLKPDNLIALAPLQEWEEAFPQRVRGGIGWLQAKSWLISQCLAKGPVTVGQEVADEDWWQTHVGDWVVLRGQEIFEARKRQVETRAKNHVAGIGSPKFACVFDEHTQIGKITRVS